MGIAGGLAVLPFQGLELNLLSTGFFGASLYLSTKKLSEVVVGEEKISASSYQTVLVILFLILLFATPLWQQERISAGVSAKDGTLLTGKINGVQNAQNNALYDEVVAKVLPGQGFQTRIIFGDALVRLTDAGIIDLEKFKRIYSERGMNEKELALLTSASSEPIKIDANNAGLLVNLLWPIGLANKTIPKSTREARVRIMYIQR